MELCNRRKRPAGHLLALSLHCLSAYGLNNGVGSLPPLGYNTWNDLGCAGLNETNLRDIANHLVLGGYSLLGYSYVNLDDCWQHPDGRDPNTSQLRPHPQKFPSGMKALGDYEKLDAKTFAGWGVDYVKEDNCYAEGGPNDEDKLFAQFGALRDALNRTQRPIYFSVCGGGGQMSPYANLSYYATDVRGGSALANSWRISSDCIEWSTCQNALKIASQLAGHAGSGGFNDPDMLLGSSAKSVRRLSQARSRSQFSLWAVLMAPLLIGGPLRDLDRYDKTTYKNWEVLMVSQDPLAKQGAPATPLDWSQRVWARPLSYGEVALFLLNDAFFDWQAADVVCDAACWTATQLESGRMFAVWDVWLHRPAAKPVAIIGKPYSVHLNGGGASAMFRLFPLTPSEAEVLVELAHADGSNSLASWASALSSLPAGRFQDYAAEVAGHTEATKTMIFV
eukprot:TRINITY_DN69238_c0_g1_i2.p1 TRINITY_DN69238_c0_g1~~TRINITY_DN69238_c0_g1_i2.p1  ORF type:complete len:450 (+),score=35.82 TRINITY_DN69238_c0_g1_i2:285-1634(+)